MIINNLITKYHDLAIMEPVIREAVNAIHLAFQNDRQLLICGNGGSAADSDHIATEFLKGFMKKRPISKQLCEKFAELYGEEGSFISTNLQVGFRAISIPSFTGLNTAFANDVSYELAFAQAVNAIGREGDVLLCVSTSGNSSNVLYAAMTARARQMMVISLTGNGGGKLAKYTDILINAPGKSTPEIQERHLPIYHTICMAVEELLIK